MERSQKHVTTHQVILLGDSTLNFENLSSGEALVDDGRPHGNLPSQKSLFLGRGRELVEIGRSLIHPPAVIVLSGPPGIGKTSLVLEAAHRNAWRFPGGVAYAAGPRPEDMHTVTAEEIMTILAGAFGLQQTADLPQYTATNPTLLIMDNLESLPPIEMARLKDFLQRLGGESAAIVALRPSNEVLEDLSVAKPMPIHSGLAMEEAARYALILADQRKIPLTWERAQATARAVGGHPLLVEQLIAKARRRDLDDLLKEVEERRGDFIAQVNAVYAWSAARLDEAGRNSWNALNLFPAGNAPEGPLRAAAGNGGPQALREAALADFDPSRQVWTWHATVAEYARGQWPLLEEERRSQLIALLPAWNEWLERLPVMDGTTLSRLEVSCPNLEAVLDVCSDSSYEARTFLDALDARLPSPDRTLSLREMVAKVLKAKLQMLPSGKDANRADLLNSLGWALSALGRREDALAAAQEASEVYRQLAKNNPKAFLPNLAGNLNNLGIRLSALGRREDALAATQEASGIYRQLAKNNPQAFLSGLAKSLNNLGSRFSVLGHREDALAAAQEASDICRKLAKTNPRAFLPDLAGSLNNLGNCLSEMGHHEGALAATQEASDIYRQLAKNDPQAFLSDLAKSLNNLGNQLSALDRREDALVAAQEASDTYRQLAKTNPQAFLPDLAMSLNNLGNCLSALGHREDALAATQEASGICRQLAKTNPKAFMPDLAISLNNLGNRLSALGRREDALAAAQEASDICRQLVKTNPQAFLPDLAMSLNNLSNCLSDLGYHEGALVAAKETMAIRRQLAKACPQAFLLDLAGSLSNFSNCLSTLGRHENALAAAQETSDIHRKLAKTNPKAFMPYMAVSLNNLSNCLYNLGRHDEALAAAQEASGICHQLTKTNPQAFLPELAGILNNLCCGLSALGRREDALAAAREASDIYRQLAKANPQAFLPDLSISLGAYGRALLDSEHPANASQAFAEGLQHLSHFYKNLPQAFAGLAMSLKQDYLNACQKAGQEPDMELLSQFS